MAPLQLEILDCGVQIECPDGAADALLQEIYGSFRRPITQARVSYRVAPGVSDHLFIAREGCSSEVASGPGDFIFKFDKDLIIEMQKLRPDLYFIHAAVVAFRKHAIALVAPSGFGKSTTTWALLQHGFKYLSDEIAPIDPTTFRVLPFPRALCLKKNPPSDYRLPQGAIVTGRSIHIPKSLFLADPASEPLPLSMVFFLRFIGEGESPVLKSIGLADATIRLLANALNPLAHPQYGLDEAMAIVAKAPCYELLTGNLRSTCELITATCVQHLSDAGTELDQSGLS